MYMAEMPRLLPVKALIIYLKEKYNKDDYIMTCMWIQTTGRVADKDKFPRYGERKIVKREEKSGDELVNDLIAKFKKKV